MARHAAKSPRPEDLDPVRADPDFEANDPVWVPVDLAMGLPRAAAEDSDHDAEWPAPKTLQPQRTGSGVLTLIVIALAGMAVGFIGVMLM